MDYAAAQPDAIIRFHASDMCLHIDSDDVYLVQSKACSCALSQNYLIENPLPPNIRSTPYPNGQILTKCQTIRTIMDSAAEAETGTIFLNNQQAVPIRTDLIKMGHPQLPTPIKTDSATSYGILTSNMLQKRSKALTCDSTGCAAASSKISSACTVRRKPKTLPITSPITSLPNTTYG